MKILEKNKGEAFIFGAIIFSYFVTRIYNLLSLPIFTDEAIYTRWAQIAQGDAAWRFISLTDGKQPSFVWFHMILLRFFEDPLLAGRMVSVFTGAGTMLGLFFLTHLIFKNVKISLLAMFIYLIYPFAIVYDRLALYESILAMFFVWSLYFQILLVRKLRLDIAMILGFVLGGGVLTKSSGFLAIYMMPLLFLLLDFSKKVFRKNFVKLVILMVISAVIANIMYSVLRLSPFFHIIEQKNSIFVYSVSEWLAFPIEMKIANFISNARGLFDWFVVYFGAPFLVVVLFSFLYRKNYREKLLLVLWFLIPFAGLLVLGKTLYPRYEFFMTIPLIPLLAFGLVMIFSIVKKKILVLLIAAGFFIWPIYSSYMVLANFSNAPIPKSDLEQLTRGWPSGGGVKESIDFFKKEANDKEIIIATQGTFGLMPYAYEIYLSNDENIEIKGMWPIEDTPSEEIYELGRQKEVFFVFYQPCPQCEYPGDGPDTWPMEKVSEFKKGSDDVSLSIYKFTGEN